FFSSRRRHTRWPRDWSSDVCSSDLPGSPLQHRTDVERRRSCRDATADGGHAPGHVAGNSRERQEDADTDVHRPPRCAGQDRRGLGAGGIARRLSATWSCPEHSRLGGQFLASAKQLLIPTKMTVANLTTVNECNGDFSPISLSLSLFSWIRKPLYSYRYSGWEKKRSEKPS